jgi:hypothetical protein
MADVVFIQRSRVGRRLFALRGDELEITAQTLGRREEARIPVRAISADYRLDAKRSTVTIFASLGFAGVCFQLAAFVCMQDIVSKAVAIYPLMFAGVFVWVAFQFVPRLEFFTFTDHARRPLFSILREKEQREECDSFVHALLDRIEQTDSGSGGVDTPLRDEAAPRAPGGRWKWAILAGVISTGFPPAAYYVVPEAAGLSLPIVVVASTCGLIAGGWSFAVREPGRYWALLGGALCLVPLLFY